MKRSNILTLISIFTLALACTGCYNLTGENHSKATKEAQEYARKANAAGADVKFVECTDHDTDGDGYLACDFIIDGLPVTLDCAGKNLIQDNHGCKAYVAKMRVTNVSSN